MRPQLSLARRAFRTFAAVLATVSLVGSGALAASAAPVEESWAPASLSGTVTAAATGDGIEGASVVVLTDDGVPAGSASTGSTGGYTVSGLEPGRYRVSIDAAPGYEAVFWPAASSVEGAEAVVLGPGETRVGVDAQFPPVSVVDETVLLQDDGEPVVATFAAPEFTTLAEDSWGSISGTVRHAATGEPVGGVQVRATTFSPQYIDRYTTTTDDGSYTFEYLDEGDYEVLFGGDWWNGSPVVVQYWDGVRASNDATMVSVTPGGAVTGIDASIQITRISGTVRALGAPLGSSPDPSGRQGTVWAYAADGSGARTAVQQTPIVHDGGYVFNGLPPGEYVLRAAAFNSPDRVFAFQFYDGASTLGGAWPVSVADGDELTGYDFDLEAGGEISGTVSGVGGGQLDEDLAWAIAYRWSGDAWHEVHRVSTWGTYSFSDQNALPVGTYTVGFESDGYCPQYWNDKTSLDTADTFGLSAGETRAGIDAHLTADCGVPEITAGTPAVSGAPQVGQTLTALPGSWEPDPVELSYEWLANAAPIPGATGSALTLTAEQEGAQISVRVSGSRSGHTPASATSPDVGPVAPGTLTISDPRISGDGRVGQEVVVDASDWGPAPIELTYQWLADGEPVEGATSDRFTPDGSLVGTVLSVRVSATKPGYVDAERSVIVGQIPPSLGVSTPRAQRGEEIVVTGGYFVAGEEVLIELHSTPIGLATVVTDAEGAFTTTVTVPATAEIGPHDVVATGQWSGRIASVPLDIYEAAAIGGEGPTTGGGGSATGGGGSTTGTPGAGTGGLAATGGGISGAVLTFGILLIATGGLIAWRRRVTS